MPILSVISPAYNQENFIAVFLQSIAAQNWRDFELIIIDDASTDRTPNLIETYLSELGCTTVYIRHNRNLGEKETIAEAFSKITGSIVLKMDADSLFGSDTFEKIVHAFVSDEHTGLATAYQNSVDQSNWLVRGAEVFSIAYQRSGTQNNKEQEHAFGTCFAFRREIFSIQEIATRTDVDLSWLARERGWKIVLIRDIVLKTRFPSTLTWTFSRGRRDAEQILRNYYHHTSKLFTRAGFWARFMPLILALVLTIKPFWALTGLVGWIAILQIFLVRQAPDYPLRDRLAASGVVLVRWSGFDVETLLIATRSTVTLLKHITKSLT